MLSRELRGLAGWLLRERPAGPLPGILADEVGRQLAELADLAEALEERQPLPPAAELEARAAAAESGKLVEISSARRAH